MAAYLEDRDAALPWADWLIEQGLNLSDILLAYVGGPPHWTGGLPHDVLVWWCKGMTAAWNDWGARALLVKSVQPDPSVYLGFLEKVYRDSRVDFSGPYHMHPSEAYDLWRCYGRRRPGYTSEKCLEWADGDAQAVLIRDWKRRTLQQFQDVFFCDQRTISGDLLRYGQDKTTERLLAYCMQRGSVDQSEQEWVLGLLNFPRVGSGRKIQVEPVLLDIPGGDRGDFLVTMRLRPADLIPDEQQLAARYGGL